jgi:transcriptional regulator with XRE-family HTH domain
VEESKSVLPPRNKKKIIRTEESMEDIRSIIANNLVILRRKKEMTQTELAEMLNYSDKAVSKWERGESVPDIAVLKNIADIFGVTVDYLITADHAEDDTDADRELGEQLAKMRLRKRSMIMGMSIMLVWLVAAAIFVPIDITVKDTVAHFTAFLFACPVSALVWLIFNSIWFNKRRNFLIISLLIWSLIAAVHILFLILGFNIWQIYLLGIPGQLITALWSVIGRKIK